MNHILLYIRCVSICFFILSFSIISTAAVHGSEYELPKEYKIDWSAETECFPRYEAACHRVEQVLSNKNWSEEKKAAWSIQCTWCVAKSTMMSFMRYLIYVNIITKDAVQAGLTESNTQYINSEMEACGEVMDKLRGSLDIKLSYILSLIKQKSMPHTQKLEDEYACFYGNIAILNAITKQQQGRKDLGLSAIQDSLDMVRPDLHAELQALFYTLTNSREKGAAYYKDAIQQGMTKLSNRAKTSQHDYEVAKDMVKAIDLLETARDMLQLYTELSREDIKKLDAMYAELSEIHERISYAPTYHLRADLCRIWFKDYATKLSEIRKCTEHYNATQSKPLLLEKENLDFLYFIAL